MPNSSIDFEALRHESLPYLPAILQRLIPGGKIVGREYIVRNPKRSDAKPGSFKINLTTGRWADWAVDVGGYDTASLVAYILDMTQPDAARWVMRSIGKAV